MSDYESDDSVPDEAVPRRPNPTRTFHRVQPQQVVDLSPGSPNGSENANGGDSIVHSAGSSGLAAPIAVGIPDLKFPRKDRNSKTQTFNLSDLAAADASNSLDPSGSLSAKPPLSQRKPKSAHSNDSSSYTSEESDSDDRPTELPRLEITTTMQGGRRRPRPMSSEFDNFQREKGSTPRSNRHSTFRASRHGRAQTSDLTDTEAAPRAPSRTTSSRNWKPVKSTSMSASGEIEAFTDTEVHEGPAALVRRKKSKYFEPIQPVKSSFTAGEGRTSPRQASKRRSTYEIAPRGMSEAVTEATTVSNLSVKTTGEQANGSGTMEQLIAHFIYGIQDLNLVRQIILAKEAFTTSSALLALLIDMFDQTKAIQQVSERSQVQIRIINFFKKWLSTSPDDFEEPVAATLLDAFLDQLILTPETETWSKLLTTSWKIAQTELTMRKAIARGEEEHEDAPPSIVTSKLSKIEHAFRLSAAPIASSEKLWKAIELDEINLEEFARQWTLVDHRKFAKIKFHEFIHKHWEKPELSPHVVSLNKHFNRSTRWVGTLIVKEYTPKKRAKALTNMITLGEHLLAMRNYFGAMAVVIGISQSSILRLTSTWEKLSSGAMEKWRNLEAVGNPMNNFKALRALQDNALINTSIPFLPSPTLLFRDLLFIEDGNEDWIDEEAKALNWEKVKLYGRAFESIHLSQTNAFPYKHLLVLQKYVSHFHTLTEDEIMKVSKTVEPPSTKGKK